MKKQLLTLSTLFITYFASAQVGIGTTSPSEALDVETSDATKTAIDINNTSTGDPKINFQLNGTTNFSIGIDNSDSDKLKIGTSALETNTAITIDGSQNVGVGTSSPISGLDIQTSMGLKVTTITAATTLNNTHNVVLCNTGPYTVTLPAAASNTGRTYYIKNIDTDGDDITIDGNGSETIDGSATYVLDTYLRNVKIISNGTSWFVISDGNNGAITTLTCGSATNNGTLTENTAASGVSSVVPYTGGNGGTHSGQTVSSTGVTGLTATLSAGSLASGSGSLTYNITGTPASSGTATFALSIGGQSCTLTRTVAAPASASIPGNATCTGATISATSCASVSGATINDNGTTTLGTEYNWTGATTSGMANTSTTQALVEIGGQCWMRYNMNITPTAFNPVPTWVNSSDVGWSGIYTGGPFTNEGTLYQWSAAMNSSTTERAQGVCPTGWHVPSDCEWMYLENSLGMTTADQQLTGYRTSGDVDYDLSSAVSGGTNNSGFSGLLAGYRNPNGTFFGRTSYYGFWWSSSATGATTASYRFLLTGVRGVYRGSYGKEYGFSVRCLKD